MPSPLEQLHLVRALARGWRLLGPAYHPVDSRRRRGSFARLKDVLLGAQTKPRPGDPWAGFSGAMDRQSIEEALVSLPGDQLELIGLAYFEGRTNRAISAELGIPVGTVRRRLRAALRNLNAHLTNGGGATWTWIPWLRGEHPLRELGQVAAAGLVAASLIWVAAPVQSAPRAPRAAPPAAGVPAPAVKVEGWLAKERTPPVAAVASRPAAAATLAPIVNGPAGEVVTRLPVAGQLTGSVLPAASALLPALPLAPVVGAVLPHR